MGYDPNQPPYGQPQPEAQPPYGQPPYGQGQPAQPPPPPYGQPPYGQSPYEQTQQTPTQYAPPTQYTQPPYNAPPVLDYATQYAPPTQYTQPPYNAPPAPDYTTQPRGSRRWLWVTLSIVGGVLLLSCIGCVAFGGTIFGVVVGSIAGPRNAVDGYYKAVEQQDYARAYTYLDTNNVTIQNQPITREVFASASRTIDRVRGPVTNYTITNTNVNNGIATVTVNVTRGGQTTTQHLRLRKIGNDWKITPYQGTSR